MRWGVTSGRITIITRLEISSSGQFWVVNYIITPFREKIVQIKEIFAGQFVKNAVIY
jgi:hypothetical protein